VEALLAAETEALQLGPNEGVPPTDGTIFRPTDDPATAAVEGRWHGRRRTGGRRVLAIAAMVAGAALVLTALRPDADERGS
jgi:hypothetical protein